MLPAAGSDPRSSRAGRSTAGGAAARARRKPDAQQTGEATAMTWADFYLICFAVGFFFSLLSFLAGGLRWHLHLPHFSHPHMAPPQASAGHGTPSAGPLTASPADVGKPVLHHPAAHLSPFNFVTVTAFLAWFGGTGYLLTRFSAVWFVTGLSLAVCSGLVGGAIVF